MKKSINKFLVVIICICFLQGCTFLERVSTPKESAFIQELTEYFVEDMEGLHLEDTFDLANYYITNKLNGGNYYYVDEEKTMWGYGNNSNGQLGIGYTKETEYPADYEWISQKIAENVIHIDTGFFFTIYLTEDGSLYGMGTNPQKIQYSYIPDWFLEETVDFFSEEPTVTYEPLLIMEDVSYARCGNGNITILKKDGSVWWWGEFRTTASRTGKPVESFNYKKPVKVLEDAIYVTCGNYSAGAIKKDGSLWTWGNNTFGSCGASGSEGEFIETPIRVLERVKMVWFDAMNFNSIATTNLSTNFYLCDYSFTTFVECMDGSLKACGLEVQGKDSESSVFRYYGDIIRDKSPGTEDFEPAQITYSESFQPIIIREKDKQPNLKLKECRYGWNPEELAHYLDEQGFEYRLINESSDDDSNYEYYYVTEDQHFYFYFNEYNKLVMFYENAYGSRDGKISIGMEKAVVEEILDYSFKEEKDVPNTRYSSIVYIVDEVYYTIHYETERVLGIRESIKDL